MRAIVTGGASFIGSHLVEALIKRGDEVYVLDDLSSGSAENLNDANQSYTFDWIDLRDSAPQDISRRIRQSRLGEADILYHLAADHGGRGYVETRQVNCSNNFALDNNVFQTVIQAHIPKVIFASSGCIYPMRDQRTVTRVNRLAETDDGRATGYDADGIYGFAKLMGEMTLAAMYRENNIQSTSCRFFTVYGPRAKENHAVMSFIARAFIQLESWSDQYAVWGTGEQVRNWTYVNDIVQGMMLAADNMDGAQVLNLGNNERLTVVEAVSMTLNYVRRTYYPNYEPQIYFDNTRPVGPMGRLADIDALLALGGASPTSFKKGLERTIDWYFANKQIDQVAEHLERLLIDRK